MPATALRHRARVLGRTTIVHRAIRERSLVLREVVRLSGMPSSSTHSESSVCTSSELSAPRSASQSASSSPPSCKRSGWFALNERLIAAPLLEAAKSLTQLAGYGSSSCIRSHRLCAMRLLRLRRCRAASGSLSESPCSLPAVSLSSETLQNPVHVLQHPPLLAPAALSARQHRRRAGAPGTCCGAAETVGGVPTCQRPPQCTAGGSALLCIAARRHAGTMTAPTARKTRRTRAYDDRRVPALIKTRDAAKMCMGWKNKKSTRYSSLLSLLCEEPQSAQEVPSRTDAALLRPACVLVQWIAPRGKRRICRTAGALLQHQLLLLSIPGVAHWRGAGEREAAQARGRGRILTVCGVCGLCAQAESSGARRARDGALAPCRSGAGRRGMERMGVRQAWQPAPDRAGQPWASGEDGRVGPQEWDLGRGEASPRCSSSSAAATAADYKANHRGLASHSARCAMPPRRRRRVRRAHAVATSPPGSPARYPCACSAQRAPFAQKKATSKAAAKGKATKRTRRRARRRPRRRKKKSKRLAEKVECNCCNKRVWLLWLFKNGRIHQKHRVFLNGNTVSRGSNVIIYGNNAKVTHSGGGVTNSGGTAPLAAAAVEAKLLLSR